MGRAKRNRWLLGAMAASLAAIVSAAAWPATYVLAHTLQQSGPVIGVLHIAPSDDPIAGKPAAIAVDVTSSQPGFTLDDYLVEATLHAVSTATANRDSTITLEPSSSSSTLTGTMTFPQAGTYQLVVRGKPLQPATAFTLTYNVRAERSGNEDLSSANQATFDAILAGTASFGLLGIAAQHQISRRGRYYR